MCKKYQSVKYSSHTPTIAICGKQEQSANYIHAIQLFQAQSNSHLQTPIDYLVTTDYAIAKKCDILLLPGGGDILPSLYGKQNYNCHNVDASLDQVQLRILNFFVQNQRPVLGICKGMQLLNIYFGGTLLQTITTDDLHAFHRKDQLHEVYRCSLNRKDFFYDLFGTHYTVNSAHHQAIDQIGNQLYPVCRSTDGIIEAIEHYTLPIIGVQWHPERMLSSGGLELFTYFLKYCSN